MYLTKETGSVGRQDGIEKIRKETTEETKETKSIAFIAQMALVIVVSAMLFSGAVIAQNNPANPDRGIAQGASYSASDIETINTTNGNLMINIPLAGLPKGRGDVSQSISLMYNSKLYDVSVEETLDQNQQNALQNFLKLSDNGGWHYTANNFRLDSISRFENGVPWFDCSGSGAGKNGYSVKLVMHMPDGSSKEFRPTGFDDIYNDGFFPVTARGYYAANCNGPGTLYSTAGMTYYSTDGSYMKLVVAYDANSTNSETNPWVLYMNDGSKVTRNGGTVRKYDRNGNFVESLADNVGRSISLQKDVYINEDHITMSGVDNEPLVWKVKWKSISVNKSYTTTAALDGPLQGGVSTQTFSGSIKVVDKVTLPAQLDGLEYKFEYNTENSGTGWGELSKVTMPFGSETAYQYTSPLPLVVNTDQTVLRSPSQKTLTYHEQYDGSSNAVSAVWLYDIGKTQSVTTSPDGTISTEKHGDTSFEHKDRGLVYRTSDNHGNISERIWDHQHPPAGNATIDINSFVKTEFTTIANAAGTPSLTKIVEYTIDPNGNQTEVKEYDWVAYSSVPKDGAGNATGIPSGTQYVRKTVNAYYNSASGNNSNGYWSTGSPNVRNALSSSEVRNGSNNAVSRTEIEYDAAGTTANPTKTKVWDSYKGGAFRAYSNPLTATNSIETTATYDSYGNVLTSTDAKGVVSQITYGAINGYSGLYPTQTKSAYGTAQERTATAEYDFYTGLVTSATDVDNSVTSETEYDALGRTVKSIAATGTSSEVWSQTEYDDTLRRVITRSDLETKGDGKAVSVRHFDELGRLRLARSIENISTQDPTDEADGIKVQSRYKFDNPANPASSNGTYSLTSNPYRAATSTAASSEPSMGWTLSYSDKTGRLSTNKSYSGSALPAPWGSSTAITGTVTTRTDANRTLVIDQAGKKRISKSNALGQLTDIWEIKPSDSSTVAVSFPNESSVTHGYQTSYQYDTLSNLTTVNQGVQTRTFTYSSLSRLLTAVNPESGTIGYAYDNNGNLTQKTDARGVQTAYTYDNINRITQRSYSNEPAGQTATPTVTYTYDNLTGRKGQLTKVENSVSTTEYTAYDILERVTKSKQTTYGTAYGEMEYTYNLSGALIKTKYPSGREVVNELDNDGRLSIVRSKKTQNHGLWDYASGFKYTVAGAVSDMQLGNGKWESTTFNSRLQPTQIALGTTQGAKDKLDLAYEYSTTGNTDNNGNVLKQTIKVNSTPGQNNGFTAVQNYTYDELNRLKTATETIGGNQSWKEAYTFDRFGNKNFDEANTTTLTKACGGSPLVMCDNDRSRENPEIDPASNRIKELQPDGDQIKDYEYDQAGNTTKDPDGRVFKYDGENKQMKVVQLDSNGNEASTIGEYFFDGDGKRVKKVVPSTGETTIFHYDAGGKLIAEYSTIVETSNPQVSYLTNDHLGSPRITTDKNGNVFSRRDFLPFGKELTVAETTQRNADVGYAADSVRQKFTGYERDSETELDFAQARIHNYNHGRFTSPDDFLNDTDPAAPQSWNLYVYVRNGPLKYIDPTGEYFVGTDGQPVTFDALTGGLSDNASNDLKRYFNNALATSPQATATFFDAFYSPTRINFVISQEEGVYKDPENPTDVGPLLGYAQPHDEKGNILEWSAKEGGWVGNPEYDEDGNYVEVTVTIFEPTSVEYNRNGSAGLPKDPSITSDQAILLTGAHELTHPTDRDAIKEIRNKNKLYPTEDAPEKVRRQVYEDIKKYMKDIEPRDRIR